MLSKTTKPRAWEGLHTHAHRLINTEELERKGRKRRGGPTLADVFLKKSELIGLVELSSFVVSLQSDLTVARPPYFQADVVGDGSEGL